MQGDDAPKQRERLSDCIIQTSTERKKQKQ